MGTHPSFESDFDCLTEFEKKMKLYCHKMSPYSRLVEITAALNGQELELRYVDLFGKEHKEDWFGKINPKRKVPALELDDGEILTESVIIAKYLCKICESSTLYPGWLDHNGRAKQDELLVDIENIEFFYFPMSRIFGMIPESVEGLA